jgi:hypothetical protein
MPGDQPYLTAGALIIGGVAVGAYGASLHYQSIVDGLRRENEFLQTQIKSLNRRVGVLEARLNIPPM